MRDGAYYVYGVMRTKFSLIKYPRVAGGMPEQGDSGGGLMMLRGGAYYVYGVLSTKPWFSNQDVRTFTDVLYVSHLDWLRKQWRRLLESKLKHPNDIYKLID